MTESEISGLIVEWLYERREHATSWNDIAFPESFVQFAARKGITMSYGDVEQGRLFREAFSRLITMGIIVPGDKKGNIHPPWFSITEYGRQCFEENTSFPYDPDGFVAPLLKAVPKLDDIALMYLRAGIRCFADHNYLPCVVMVGGALERIILVLIDILDPCIPASLKTSFSKIQKEELIKKKFDGLLKFINDYTTLDKRHVTMERLNSLFPAIVGLIRITRNQTGHPTGREISRDEAQATILLAKEGILIAYQLPIDLTF